MKRTIAQLLLLALLALTPGLAGELQSKSATIAAGASLSSAVYMKTGTLVTIIVPATWTAANITFKGSLDGTNFYDLYDEFSAVVTVTVGNVGGAGRCILVAMGDYAGPAWLKVQSGATGALVAQVSAATLELGVRELP